ncbi:MAG: hypothetical protein ACO3FK_11370, partial [Vulcanococcus sp.]
MATGIGARKTVDLRSGTRSTALADMQELALQGTLFGLEPVEHEGRETAKTKAPSREASCDPLDEAALTEDATRRPRQRQQQQQTSPAEATASSSATDSDLPPWHHH